MPPPLCARWAVACATAALAAAPIPVAPAHAAAGTPAAAVFTSGHSSGSSSGTAGDFLRVILSSTGSSGDYGQPGPQQATSPADQDKDLPADNGRTTGGRNNPYADLVGYPGRNPTAIKQQTFRMRRETQVPAADFWTVNDCVVRVNVVTSGCDDLRGWVDATGDTVRIGVINGLPVDGNPWGVCTDALVFSTIDIAVPGGIRGRTVKQAIIPPSQLAG